MDAELVGNSLFDFGTALNERQQERAGSVDLVGRNFIPLGQHVTPALSTLSRVRLTMRNVNDDIKRSQMRTQRAETHQPLHRPK